jgi:hypothetical protein
MRKQTITEMLAIGQLDLLRVFYAWCFWGSPDRLGEFLQAYAVERAKIEARKKGHTVTEQTLVGGDIKLTIHVSGGVT